MNNLYPRVTTIPPAILNIKPCPTLQKSGNLQHSTVCPCSTKPRMQSRNTDAEELSHMVLGLGVAV